ncbi:hypothetical protein CBX96_04025 [Shewanella sp. BC20]|uniref:hypothetical protein n=1 Tax=Shewanella sp. BC20 TaxID=2004459 RepID=UPI000D64572F|nr:hypothetical protein [Shewanella sp. BC20]PWF64940.1 hypothetical protein CBX96_04025 [Shewanella sp. BC20]
MEGLTANVNALNKQLVRLDGTVQAIGAVSELLSLCPPEHKVNANALGQLLFVLHKDIEANLLGIDTTQQRISEHIQTK